VTTDTTVAFLYMLVAFIEGPFGFQCHRHIAAVARACIDLRILDLSGGFRPFEWMWGVCRFEGFAVEHVGFVRPDVVKAAEGSSLLLLKGCGKKQKRGLTLIPISIPVGTPLRFPMTPVPQVGQNCIRSAPNLYITGMERRYLVLKFLGPELIVAQRPFAFLDCEAACAWKYPLIALPRTNTAVTAHECGYLWDLDAEFEGSAVAVAIVGFEFRG
jgi:hypothetical protein